jgi:hypothetical protein
MIRLRLGDWFKSNYSKFGLARLFGLGAPGMLSTELSEDQKAENAKNEYACRIKWANWAGQYLVDPLDNADFQCGFPKDHVVICKLAPTVKAVDEEGTPVDGEDPALAEWAIAITAGVRVKGTVQSELNDATLVKHRIKIPVDVPAADRAIGVKARHKSAAAYVIKVDEASWPVGWKPEYQYLMVPHSACSIPKKVENAKKLEFREEVGTWHAEDPETMRAFLKENPLAKAFESTAGRGLAGFITQMDFDQADAPWEIDRGYRAPIFLKVSLSFAPIHDLAPGLDHDGMMLAPVYPVGSIAGGIARDPHYDGFVGDHDFETNVAAQEAAAAKKRAEITKATPTGNPSDTAKPKFPPFP